MSEKKPLDKKPIHDLLTEKDAFLTTSEKVQEYVLRHTRGLIVAVAAVALVIVAAALYLNFQKKAELTAALAYEDSLAALDASEDEGLAALEKVRSDFAGRRASRLAAFRLVSLYAEKKDLDQALPLAEELLKTLRPEEAALKPVLLRALGGLYEVSGDYSKAAAGYETLLAMDYLGPNLKLDILMSLGRVYAAAGRPEEATRNYEQVVREFPQALQAFMANAKLAELKGSPSAFPLPAEMAAAAAAPGPDQADAAPTEAETSAESPSSSPSAEAGEDPESPEGGAETGAE